MFRLVVAFINGVKKNSIDLINKEDEVSSIAKSVKNDLMGLDDTETGIALNSLNKYYNNEPEEEETNNLMNMDVDKLTQIRDFNMTFQLSFNIGG